MHRQSEFEWVNFWKKQTNKRTNKQKNACFQGSHFVCVGESRVVVMVVCWWVCGYVNMVWEGWVWGCVGAGVGWVCVRECGWWVGRGWMSGVLDKWHSIQNHANTYYKHDYGVLNSIWPNNLDWVSFGKKNSSIARLHSKQQLTRLFYL